MKSLADELREQLALAVRLGDTVRVASLRDRLDRLTGVRVIETRILTDSEER